MRIEPAVKLSLAICMIVPFAVFPQRPEKLKRVDASTFRDNLGAK